MRVALAAIAGAGAAGPFPVVGIFSAPSSSTVPECGGNCEYIAASYIKYVESAGARAIPISYYSTNEEIDAVVDQVNGILFPGGGADIPDAAQRIVDNALHKAEEGGYFPVWGTCLGFEWLVQAVGGKSALQGGFDAENITLPLDFTDAGKASRLYHDAEARQLLASKPVTMNNHQSGIEPTSFASNTKLAGTFDVLSTNKDRKGRSFVSSIEGKTAPIYGAQYHPEKNLFEWGTSQDGTPYEVIQHTPEAVQAAQALINFFINETRKNSNVYDLTQKDRFFEARPTDLDMAPEFVQVYHLFPKRQEALLV
mmetsp:Transcript_12905/g.31026  ORF Transcript_12905/g.31026 Transcript_12905/m.31026 type:complete len:311 (+) Transcript_12905:52-984(+)